MYYVRVVIFKMKVLQNRTVFVVSTLFLERGVCEHHFIFMKGVPASKKVGNLWFRVFDNKRLGGGRWDGRNVFSPWWTVSICPL